MVLAGELCPLPRLAQGKQTYTQISPNVLSPIPRPYGRYNPPFRNPRALTFEQRPLTSKSKPFSTGLFFTAYPLRRIGRFLLFWCFFLTLFAGWFASDDGGHGGEGEVRDGHYFLVSLMLPLPKALYTRYMHTTTVQ